MTFVAGQHRDNSCSQSHSGIMSITWEKVDLACRRLLVLHVPTDFIYLVLMAWWIKEMGYGWDLGDGLDLIEFYSGVGRIAKSAFHMGLQSRSFDIDHDKPPLGESVHSNMPKRSSFDLNGEAGFLLAIMMILHGKWADLISTLAVVCSSWSVVNLATSQRNLLLPYGNARSTSVIRANRMVARTALLILLIFVLEGWWILENPGCSVICLHPRLRWCFDAMRRAGAKVYRLIFNMEEFGSETLKPTMLLSNSKALARLNSKRERGQVKRATGKRLCRKYLNKK